MSSSPEQKRSSEDSSSAVAVTPEKPIKKQRKTDESSPKDAEEYDVVMTAGSIMGFPRYPNASNGEIMKNHYDFVLWAKKKKANGDAHGRLKEFVDWVESPEGQTLELESEGNVKFCFGTHKGETFMDVARNDPGYHERYMHALRRKGEEPNSVLSQYMSWFKNGGRFMSSLSAAGSPAARSPAARSDVDGSEKFSSGTHKGKTFRYVATADPSYHLRCEATGYCPGGIERYRRYFDVYGDQYAAERGEHDAIRCAAGIYVPDFDDYEYDL